MGILYIAMSCVHRSVWWMRVGINSQLSSILAFTSDLKIQTQHRLFWVFRADKPLQPIGQAAEFKFESKFKPLQVIWQSLPKATPEDNRRILLQNKWPSSWGSAPAQVGLVGWARSTGSFRVCCCFFSCELKFSMELARTCC